MKLIERIREWKLIGAWTFNKILNEMSTEEIEGKTCGCGGLLILDPSWEEEFYEWFCCEDCGTFFRVPIIIELTSETKGGSLTTKITHRWHKETLHDLFESFEKRLFF